MRLKLLLKTTALTLLLLIAGKVGWSAVITSNAVTGNWSDVATWNGGIVPGASDDVIIADGAVVSIDATPITIASLTVGQGVSGMLVFDGGAAKALTVTGDITIATGGIFKVQQDFSATGDITNGSPTVTNVSSTSGLIVGMIISGSGIPGGTTVTAFDATTITLSANATATTATIALTAVVSTTGTTNTLAIGGNLTNNGVFDMTLGAASYICNVTFNKVATSDQTISGAGTTTRFRGITLNRANIADKVVCGIDISLSGSGTFVFTKGTWEQNAGTLTVSTGNQTVSANGSLIFSGSGSLYQPGSSYDITGNLTVNTSGTLNIGNGTNRLATLNATATINFLAGTINVGGRLTLNNGTTTINGANIIVDPQIGTSYLGATSNTFEASGAATVNFSSGSITIVDPNAAITTGNDLKIAPTTGAFNMTGGTIYLGDGVSTSVSATVTAGKYKGFNLSTSGATVKNLVVQTGDIDGRNCQLKGGLVVSDILTLTSGTLDLYTQSLTLNNPIAGTPTKLIDNITGVVSLGTLNISGTATNMIIPSSLDSLANLVINNANGAKLQGDLVVKTLLTITSGTLDLGSGNLILASTGSIAAGYDATKYIITSGTGALKMNTVAAGSATYPIGASASSYSPFILTNNTSSDVVGVQVKGYPFTHATLNDDNSVHLEWLANEATPGGNDGTMTLQWNAADQGSSFDPTKTTKLGIWNGTSYDYTVVTVLGSDPYTVTANCPANLGNPMVIVGPSNQKAISSFEVTGQVGTSVIDQTAHTIYFVMPVAAPLTGLQPTITVSDDATVSPLSGASQDFVAGTPVDYTVTAEDGTTQVYQVTAKTEATVDITDITKTYTGLAQGVTTTTTPGGLTVDVTYDGSSTVPTAAGTYAVVATINEAAYAGTASGTLTINQAILTVTADDMSRVYGDANPTFTGTITGYVNSETASVITGSAVYTSAADATSPAGTPVTITTDVSGMSADNYSFTAVNGALSITKAVLTVTADNTSKEYGEANPTFTSTITGYKNGQDASVITGDATYTCTANATSPVGTPVAITPDVSGMTATNYSFTGVDGALTITKAVLTVTADDNTRVYGEVNPTFTSTITGYKNGEDATVITGAATYTCTAVGTSPVGTPVAITPDVSGMSADNYSFTGADGALTITKAVLTVTADDKTRIYGDANPTFTATITGFANSENESVITGTPSFTCLANATSPAGTPVTITTDVSGMSADNYSFVGADGSLTITKATATVTLGTLTFHYDGNPQPVSATTNPASLTVDITYEGTNGTTYALSSTAPTDLGEYNVVATVNELNYTGSTSGTEVITNKIPATVTITNTIVTYDGNQHAVSIATAQTSDGTPITVTVNVTYDGSSTPPTNAGSYPVVATIDDVTYDGVGNSTLTINQVALSVTADNNTREYGEANPSFTGAISGFVNGEDESVITGSATYSSPAIATTSAGTANIIPDVSGMSATNYSFTAVNGTLTITKALLTVTANDKTRTYGASNPTFTSTITGYKNSETNSVITGSIAYTCTASGTSPVGTPVTITPDISGLTATNYTFTAADGSLTITKAALTVTADNKTKTYGDVNPTLTGTITGFMNSESESVLTGSPVYTCTADVTSAAGTPVIITTDISGMSADNYTLTGVNGSLTITKAVLTVTADDKSRVYGDANPTFTGTITGFVNSESESVITGTASYTCSAIATSPAGTPVTITSDVSGMSATNYSFTAVNGALTITKATLTVTADNKSRVYGDVNPTFTGTITGFANSETESVITGTATYTCLADATSPAGTPVTITTDVSGMSATNYSFTGVNGALTITKATATVTISNTDQNYDGTAKPVTVVTSPVGLTVDVTYNGSTTVPTAVGSYTVVATVNDINYQGSQNATLNIIATVLTKTIHEIQFTTDASGDSPFATQTVATSGIITAIKYNSSQVQQGFYIQDGSGAWNGVYVYAATPIVAVGDNVTVTGTVVEYFKMTEISPVSNVTISSSGNPLPNPVELTTLAANDESYESVLVKVKAATCSSFSSGTAVVNDGSGDLTAYKNLYSAFTLTAGDKYDITGIIADYYTTSTDTHLYELYPRSADDISNVTGINENWDSNLSVYPNPFTNEIRFTGTQNVERVIVSNIIGQVLKNVAINQVNSINTQDLPKGIYLVTLMNSKGDKITLKMIKH